ncbi:hypothetical protein HJG60_011616 [Phyllostomus discolor]|uniref:Uncharacterized protein n=1 Tax=Phyllostomus discolor TaxID=89673 RepID=A0A834E3B5_9CHIR|nr:hypothetical protein HJG60_011616 [Phyllostomus discolor]
MVFTLWWGPEAGNPGETAAQTAMQCDRSFSGQETGDCLFPGNLRFEALVTCRTVLVHIRVQDVSDGRGLPASPRSRKMPRAAWVELKRSAPNFFSPRQRAEGRGQGRSGFQGLLFQGSHEKRHDLGYPEVRKFWRAE